MFQMPRAECLLRRMYQWALVRPGIPESGSLPIAEGCNMMSNSTEPEANGNTARCFSRKLFHYSDIDVRKVKGR